jgi:hypothetical protein
VAFVRYGVALILTILMLGIARRTSTRHPEDYSQSVGDLTASHRTVTEDFGGGPSLEIQVSDTDSLEAVVYYSIVEGGPYNTDTLDVSEAGFSVVLPVHDKGEKLFYHLKLYKNGEELAQFPPDGDQFIKFKGHVPAIILIPHIFCMFAIVFFGFLTVISAVDFARGRGDLSKSVRYLLWTVIFAFVGGFPLGYLVAYLAFGQGWGGIPIGWDITDNKTVLLFLFWLVTFILARKGLKGDRMAISANTYKVLTIVSLAVSIIMFMIPHSI